MKTDINEAEMECYRLRNSGILYLVRTAVKKTETFGTYGAHAKKIKQEIHRIPYDMDAEV